MERGREGPNLQRRWFIYGLCVVAPALGIPVSLILTI
jgi:hypothetical protein